MSINPGGLSMSKWLQPRDQRRTEIVVPDSVEYQPTEAVCKADILPEEMGCKDPPTEVVSRLRMR